MPNSSLRRAAAALCLGASCTMVVLSTHAQAQSLPVRPVNKTVDLTLLQKALSPLVNSKVADSESEMQIFASKSGAVFTLHEHLKVTARRPGRFVSEVTLLPGMGAPPTRYVVASDGLKVTTYRPGLKKYSVAPLAQFEAGEEDFPSLGLVVGLLYLGDTSFIKGLSSISKDGTGQGQAMLRKMGMALSSKPVVTGGVSYETFTLQMNKIGLYKFTIDPGTGQLSQVEMRTVQDGVTIHMVERILSFSPLTSVPPGTFQASVPPDTKKVKQLSVSFF